MILSLKLNVLFLLTVKTAERESGLEPDILFAATSSYSAITGDLGSLGGVWAARLAELIKPTKFLQTTFSIQQ